MVSNVWTQFVIMTFFMVCCTYRIPRKSAKIDLNIPRFVHESAFAISFYSTVDLYLFHLSIDKSSYPSYFEDRNADNSTHSNLVKTIYFSFFFNNIKFLKSGLSMVLI